MTALGNEMFASELALRPVRKFRHSLRIAALLFVFLSGCGCQERQSKIMANKINWRPWMAGRYNLELPETATLLDQDQILNGIILKFEPTTKGASYEGIAAGRRAQLAGNPRTPIVKESKWTGEMGSIEYVKDSSYPDYYQVEGRRVLDSRVLVAITNGDKKYSDVMQKIVQEALASFNSDVSGAAQSYVFGMSRGVLALPFRNQEQVSARYKVPEVGAVLEFNTNVVATPVKVDLFDRIERAAALARSDGMRAEVLYMGQRQVGNEIGDETLMSATDSKGTAFEGRFETSGVAGSGSQPRIRIHFISDDHEAQPVREQFQAVWNSILDNIKLHK